MLISPGHVLEYDDTHYRQVSHYDSDGNFLEYIDLHGYTTESAHAYAMCQYRSSVYILTVNQDSTPWQFKLQEYNKNGVWVRDVIDHLDASDPIQNPYGDDPDFFIMAWFWVDQATGTIYATTASGESEIVLVFANNGTFIRTIDTAAAGLAGLGGLGMSVFVDPTDNNYLILQVQDIYRYNLTNNTFTTTAVTGTPSSRNDIDVAGYFYHTNDDSNTLQRFAPGLSSEIDYPLSAPPSAPLLDASRVGDDTDIVWTSASDLAPVRSWYLIKYRVSTGTIVAGPITIGLATGFVIWEHLVYRTFKSRIAQATLVGAQ